MRAMTQISGPVIATTLVLLSVFIPTAFMSGITGQLFKQFALTISIATCFSTINALTLSPALCGVLLRRTPEGAGQTGLFGFFNRFSIFSMKLEDHDCTQCGRCRTLCTYGGKPDKETNTDNCLRCLECTQCGPGALQASHIFENTSDNQTD